MYQRILLKISGEILSAGENLIDAGQLEKITEILQKVQNLGVQIAIVCGGGNFCRGENLAAAGTKRVTADHIGMLATVMNALALGDFLRRKNIENIVMSGFEVGGGVCEIFNYRRAQENLAAGKLVILSAGTGSPFFTTDTGAVLRGLEIDAEVIFKATKVDGVYDDDPLKNPHAVRYQKLTFDEALAKNLKIMDTAAFALCKEHGMDVCVFAADQTATLANILAGKNEGTIISNRK